MLEKIIQAKTNNKIFGEIYDHYKGFIFHYIYIYKNRYSTLDLELEDFIQNGRIALWEAILSCNVNKLQSIKTFDSYFYFFLIHKLQELCKYNIHDLYKIRLNNDEGDEYNDLRFTEESFASDLDVSFENKYKMKVINNYLKGLGLIDQMIVKLRGGLMFDLPSTLVETAYLLGLNKDIVRYREVILFKGLIDYARGARDGV